MSPKRGGSFALPLRPLVCFSYGKLSEFAAQAESEGKRGFAAQAETLDTSGLAALVEPVENIRSLPPWSNPLGKLEFAALADSYCDPRILDESVHT